MQEHARPNRERAYNAGTAIEWVKPLERHEWEPCAKSVIYFLGTHDGPVKIGRSRRLKGRFSELQVGQSDMLYVWAISPGNNLDEALWHHRFDADRLGGEWFARSAAMLDVIVMFQTRLRTLGATA